MRMILTHYARNSNIMHNNISLCER